MRKTLISLFILAGLIACGDKASETPEQPSFSIDPGRITVSGLSSGGYMAGQLHVAHSSLFSGVAILAGGPYWCAEGTLSKGLGPCIGGGDVGQERLLKYTQDKSQGGQIDPLTNLSDDTVWLFHGSNDAAVSADVLTATAEFYRQLAPAMEVVSITDVAAAHGMPTLSSGAPCVSMESPFLNACDYDAAGVLLNALYSEMHARVVADGELRTVPQPDGDDAEMLDDAYLYVPKSCAAGESCGVHVALHGCQQSAEFVGDAFAAGAGYNEWAESNSLLVLYPQVASSKLAPLNPLGCWDWWGYTGEDYATKDGAQVAVIRATIGALTTTSKSL